ncbi:MAG: hypothetical protein KME11_12320 [Timaviella obliquedivisa GSE-PSE-MK23-08B]|jgi:hypothetical protein|nr:hypothetical protein [Timaviella obliquedivisa GSE-PSE-MK23-08B]
MSWSYPLKNVQLEKMQIPWRSLIRPMFLASVGLHALILFFPTGSEKPITEKPKEEEAIKLTQLAPKNNTIVRPAPKVAAVKPRVAVRSSTVPRTTLPVPAAPSQASTQPEAASKPDTVDPFDKVFDYPGAVAGSFDLPPAFDPFSKKTTDPLAKVEGWFQQQLKTKGFVVQSTEAAATGRAVYQISSKDGQTKYLTLIPNAAGAGTTILVSDAPLPKDLVAAGQNVVSPEEQSFYSDLTSVVPIPDVEVSNGWEEIDNPNLLTEPASFYAEVLSEADYQQGGVAKLLQGVERAVIASGRSPDDAYADIAPRLEVAYYQVTPKGTYGGGSLYQISRDGVTGFLSIVPTTNGSAAIIFWSKAPN